MAIPDGWEVLILGGGPAGLSAGIYLGRALRRVLVIDQGRSLTGWEPHVQNYLGFPEGIAGGELLRQGRRQAEVYGAAFEKDNVESAERADGQFRLRSQNTTYTGQRLLLATGLFHLPPAIPGVDECVGHSMFFCKDCDAYRVRGKRIAIIGRNNQAVEYALSMLVYSSCVIIATNAKPVRWDEEHAAWIEEYKLPVRQERITEVEHKGGQVLSVLFEGGTRLAVDCIFTTRGDVYYNKIAHDLGADIDPEGQILVDACMRTSVPGLYAAGCVTPANCQIVIAAGQGAAAAQAVNRDLFEDSLRTHSFRQFRENQLQTERTLPEVV